MTISVSKPNIFFWIISILALIWNIMGVMAYLDQVYMTDEMKLTMTELQRNQLETQPSWYVAFFAIAVFTGVLGCILLLLRKKMAYMVFLISFLGVIVQQVYHFVLSDIGKNLSGFELSMAIIILLVSVLLVLYSKKLIDKGVLS